MNEDSILNQIMAKKQQEALASVDLALMVNRLLEVLNKREQEVLSSRYGLAGYPKETLEAIGKKHQLTRERIRQIETSSISKLKKAPGSEQVISKIRAVVSQLIAEHGGVIDKRYLYDLLHRISVMNQSTSKLDEHDRYADFTIGRILSEDFDEVVNDERFNNYLKLKYQTIEHLEKLIEELLAKVRDMKRLLSTEEMIALAKELPSYTENAEKLSVPNELNLTSVLEGTIDDYSDEVYGNRNIYNLLRAASDLEKNKFNQWGHKRSREITPKTINDKIYLVLKNNGKPMYYGDIAQKIQELGFDGKGVNVATTHNELILDDKYILVGRGLYGLKEWGYKNGTVADVIVSILEDNSGPMIKDHIMQKVLEQRLVKNTTVNLALMNKAKFRKIDGGYYELVK